MKSIIIAMLFLFKVAKQLIARTKGASEISEIEAVIENYFEG